MNYTQAFELDRESKESVILVRQVTYNVTLNLLDYLVSKLLWTLGLTKSHYVRSLHCLPVNP